MTFYVCDMCRRIISGREVLRYVLSIETYAAYEPMDVTEGDLKGDLRGQIRAMIEKMSKMDPQELENEVYKKMKFDLCPACHETYIKDPFFRKARQADQQWPGQQ